MMGWTYIVGVGELRERVRFGGHDEGGVGVVILRSGCMFGGRELDSTGEVELSRESSRGRGGGELEQGWRGRG